MYFLRSESGSYGTSILGNIRSGEFQLPRGISSIFNKTVNQSSSNLRNTLQRRKEKEVIYRENLISLKTWNLNSQDDDHEKGHRSYLAPPMPPVISGNRLRRVNSSTLSLNKTKKKLLTVEELYVEVLYTVLHMIGCDIDQVSIRYLIY